MKGMKRYAVVLSPYRAVVDGNKFMSENMTTDERERYLHNLKIVYQRIVPGADITSTLIPINETEYGEQLKIVLGVLEIELSQEKKEELQKLSDKVNEWNPGKWIICDLKKTLYYTSDIRRSSLIIPSSWIQNVLPLCIEEHQFIQDDYLWDPLFEQNKSEEMLSCQDVSCRLPTDFLDNQQKFEDVYFDTIGKLERLYIKGTIYGVDRSFQQRWDLYSDEFNGLYHPNWWNSYLAPQPTEFLMEMKDKNDVNNNYNLALVKSRNKMKNEKTSPLIFGGVWSEDQ